MTVAKTSPRRIDIIAGARPNFMKVAAVIRALDARRAKGGTLDYRLIHTGQHYDRGMSGGFFEQLGLPEPACNLEAGSGTQAEQTAAIMTRYERLLGESRSDLCLVVGDVNSTMACAITARKMNVPVAHVEAGIRSGDWTMPEEINRKVTDSITNWFFTTSRWASDNLRREGVDETRIHFVGNTMIDTLLANLHRLQPPEFWHALDLKPRGYLVLTLHRPNNVDESEALVRYLRLLGEQSRGLRIIFPVHPRTARTLQGIEHAVGNLVFVEPQPYLEFNYLVRHAKAVITDSGGITEEATVLGVPCLTIRDNTERPETVDIGTNELVGREPANLKSHLDRLFEGRWKRGGIPEKWDGRAGERIVSALETILA